jgi:hypothetical protein
MKVKELMERLAQLDPEMEVLVQHPKGGLKIAASTAEKSVFKIQLPLNNRDWGEWELRGVPHDHVIDEATAVVIA